jgi:hypothetical protein
LDPDTHKAWEEHAYKADHDLLPTWEELRTFLEGKFRTLELIAPSTSAPREKKPVREKTFHINTPTSPTTTTKTCIMCSQDHTLCHCKQFHNIVGKRKSSNAYDATPSKAAKGALAPCAECAQLKTRVVESKLLIEQTINEEADRSLLVKKKSAG